jgi:hypothetical protein
MSGYNAPWGVTIGSRWSDEWLRQRKPKWQSRLSSTDLGIYGVQSFSYAYHFAGAHHAISSLRRRVTVWIGPSSSTSKREVNSSASL